MVNVSNGHRWWCNLYQKNCVQHLIITVSVTEFQTDYLFLNCCVKNSPTNRMVWQLSRTNSQNKDSKFFGKIAVEMLNEHGWKRNTEPVDDQRYANPTGLGRTCIYKSVGVTGFSSQWIYLRVIHFTLTTEELRRHCKITEDSPFPEISY